MSKEIALLKIENNKKKERIKLNAHNNVTKLPKFIHELVKKTNTHKTEKYPLFLVVFFSSIGYLIGYFLKKYI